MKTMKSLKQQMTAALSLALVVVAIAVCGPEQTLAQQRMRRGASANVNTLWIDLGHPGRRNTAPRRYQIGGSSGVPTDQFPLNLKAAKRNHLILSGGEGNDTLRSANVQPRTAKPNQVIVGAGPGAGSIGHYRRTRR